MFTWQLQGIREVLGKVGSGYIEDPFPLIQAECMACGAVKDLPASDFSLKFLPSPTTLFRFSALTFNGHYIHLDNEYAQKYEGYPGVYCLRL